MYSTNSLWVGILCLVLFLPISTHAQNSGNLLSAQIDMTCFPPPPAPGEEPGMGPPPPCLLPPDIDSEFISPSPEGILNLNVNNDGTSSFVIKLRGLAPELVLTAWTSYFFPGGPVPDPIFAPIDEGLPPIAGVSAPLSPTYAAFTEGMGPEPNQFIYTSIDKARLDVTLDFNPLLLGQGPLRNAMVNTNQTIAPAGHEAEQPLCCPNGFPAPTPQPVGSSLLRSFDLNTGFQNLDAAGLPVLIRSPLPVAFIAIVAHVDKTTHGINPGVPILPIPGLSVTTGDHFLVGIFDLRAYHLSNSSAASQANLEAMQQEFRIEGVYPNPFNPTTSFQLTVQKSQRIRIDVYDVSGRLVRRIADEELEANRSKFYSFNANNLASGRYLLQIVGEHFTSSRPLILSK